MARYCERYNGIFLAPAPRLIFRGRCKQWDCHYCARENKTLWRKAIRKAIIEDEELSAQLWSMFTFTMPPSIHRSKNKEYESALVIKRIWNKFMVQFKRHYEKRDKQRAKAAKESYTPRKLTYIRVLENHKSGVFHIHLLCNISHSEEELYVNPKDDRDMRPLWLKNEHESGVQVIEHYGFGWRCHVLPLGDNTKYAINYVTKYLTKDDTPKTQDILSRSRVRRVQTSRNIKSPRNLKSLDKWIPRAYLHEGDFREDESYLDINLKKAVKKDDLDINGIYPPYNERIED